MVFSFLDVPSGHAEGVSSLAQPSFFGVRILCPSDDSSRVSETFFLRGSSAFAASTHSFPRIALSRLRYNSYLKRPLGTFRRYIS